MSSINPTRGMRMAVGEETDVVEAMARDAGIAPPTRPTGE